MIKFFRRIRKKLIDEDNLKRYTLYAIGEILLVVIGIMIALQINIWNEGRKQKNVEIKLLKEIRNDLTITSEEVIDDLNAHLKYHKSCYTFKEFLLSNETFHDSILTVFNECINDRQVYPKTGAYESMKSKGLDIVSNDSLRLKITDLYQLTFSRLIEYGQSNDKYNIYRLLYPYLKRHFKLSDEPTGPFALEGLTDSITFYKYEIRSYKNLKNDHEFLIDLQESFWLRDSKVWIHQLALKEIEDVILQINGELK